MVYIWTLDWWIIMDAKKALENLKSPAFDTCVIAAAKKQRGQNSTEKGLSAIKTYFL